MSNISTQHHLKLRSLIKLKFKMYVIFTELSVNNKILVEGVFWLVAVTIISSFLLRDSSQLA